MRMNKFNFKTVFYGMFDEGRTQIRWCSIDE